MMNKEELAALTKHRVKSLLQNKQTFERILGEDKKYLSNSSHWQESGSLFTINSRINNRTARKHILEKVYKYLNDPNLELKSAQDGGDAKIKLRGIGENFFKLVCKPYSADKPLSSATKLNLTHDFITQSGFTTREVHIYNTGKSVRCLILSNPDSIRRNVLHKISTNQNLTEEQKLIINNFFKVCETASNITDDMPIEGLDFDPKLMISFGEIALAYVMLKNQSLIPADAKTWLRKVSNLTNHPGAINFEIGIPLGQNTPIVDYILIVSGADANPIRFSVKYGAGAAASLFKIIEKACADNMNLINSELATLMRYKLTGTKQNPLVLWKYFFNAERIRLGNREVPLDEIYDICVKERVPLSEFKSEENKKLITLFKQYAEKNHTEYFTSTATKNTFPLSMSYVALKYTVEKFSRDNATKESLRIILDCMPYWQVNIDESAAERGRFKFTTKKSSQFVNIYFKTKSDSKDITMTKGSIGIEVH